MTGRRRCKGSARYTEGSSLVAEHLVGREHYNEPWEWMRGSDEDDKAGKGSCAPSCMNG